MADVETPGGGSGGITALSRPPERPLVTSALSQLLTTAVSMGAGIMLSILVARALGPAEMGSYALALMIMTAAEALAGVGLAPTVVRFAAELAGQGAAPRPLRWALPRGALIGVLAAIVLAAMAPLLGRVFDDPALPTLVAISAIVLPLALLGSLFESALEGLSRFDLLARAALVLTPAQLALTLAALAWGGAPAVMMAHLGFGAINVLLLAQLTLRAGGLARSPAPRNSELTRRMARFARRGYGLSLLAFIVQDRVEVLVVGALATADQVAFYTLAQGAAEAGMRLGPWVIATVFFPRLVADWALGDRAAAAARYAQCLRYLSLATAPLALGGLVAADIVVAVLLGPDYAPMVPVLRIALVAATAAALAQGPLAIIEAAERQDWLLRVRAPLTIVNLLLDLALVPRYAALGAAAANAAVAVTEALLLWMLAVRLLGRTPSAGLGVPFLAAAAAAAVAAVVLNGYPGPGGLALAGLLAGGVYVGVLAGVRFFGPGDVELLQGLRSSQLWIAGATLLRRSKPQR